MAATRNPFSPINASGEIRLRAILSKMGVDAKTITSTVWAGSVVHLFTKASGANPAYTIPVWHFSA